jgi:hypothetical protein
MKLESAQIDGQNFDLKEDTETISKAISKGQNDFEEAVQELIKMSGMRYDEACFTIMSVLKPRTAEEVDAVIKEVMSKVNIKITRDDDNLIFEKKE